MRAVIILLLVGCSPQTRRPAMIGGAALATVGFAMFYGEAMGTSWDCDSYSPECEDPDLKLPFAMGVTGVLVALVAGMSSVASPPAPVAATRNVVPPEDLPR
jgi:hypothetical protein